MSQSATSAVAERVLEIRRLFNAPRELVFAAWTDPKHLAQWWGPKGFTAPRCEAEARPGGKIRIDMRGPDGTIYPMDGQFREVTPPEKLVFTSSALDENGNALFVNLNTVTFEDFGDGRTMLTVRAQVIEQTPEAAKYLKGMNLGWSLTIDRLESFVLATGPNLRPVFDGTDTTARQLIATRVFDAPRDLCFRMWTDPEHVANWWGPHGFTNTIYEMDVRPGGTWLLAMHGPNGVDYISKSTYVEIAAPERLVLDHATPPFRMTVTFKELGNQTEVTAKTVFESAALLKKEKETVGADKGLQETLDCLGEYLDTLNR
jgi:uncharacterized protein YndB with AHSA1/START domain